MKNFLDENFLLNNDTAVELFHSYAKDMPIFDYHCHVNVSEIVEDKSYRSITELWLGGDHYKWRAMRLFGIDEKYITGDASDLEKFKKYAEMIGYAIGNPLYHWTHLELQRYFNIFETLSLDTAEKIFYKANKMLSEGLSTRKLIKMSNVTALCSTDDPVDSLEHHIALKNEGYEVNVMPTFRPDKSLDITNVEFFAYIEKLAKASGIAINNYDDILSALSSRLDFFSSVGCKLSDHSIAEMPYAVTSKEEVSQIFEKAKTQPITALEEEKYRFFTFNFLAKEYGKRNYIMQLHIGALRNNNTKMKNRIGVDAGFDSIDDRAIAHKLSRFLDSAGEMLPKTIVYTLNPKDNFVLGTMMGNFAENGTKVHFGTAWWFNDHRDGMVEQFRAYSNLGMLSKFIGMLTDSRSFTSYTRHEYFRRILCQFLGDMVEKGEFPKDMKILGKIVKDISYNNIMEYFWEK